MFIRKKTISKKEYAYLVENKWRKRRKNKVKQKTLKYLGKVYKLEKINNQEQKPVNAEQYTTTQPKKIILERIRREIQTHGFQETKKNIFEKENKLINLTKCNVKDKKTKKQLCLEINNNFFCSYTLRKLIHFIPKQGLTDLEIGKQLATAFESAGVSIPKELFVILAQKILKEGDKP